MRRRGLLAATALLLLLAALAWRSVVDIDVGIHLAGGRWIAEHRAVPALDPFTYSVSDHPYVAYHWLFQLALHACERAAGVTGLVLLRLSLLLATGFLLLATLRARGTSRRRGRRDRTGSAPRGGVALHAAARAREPVSGGGDLAGARAAPAPGLDLAAAADPARLGQHARARPRARSDRVLRARGRRARAQPAHSARRRRAALRAGLAPQPLWRGGGGVSALARDAPLVAGRVRRTHRRAGLAAGDRPGSVAALLDQRCALRLSRALRLRARLDPDAPAPAPDRRRRGPRALRRALGAGRPQRRALRGGVAARAGARARPVARATRPAGARAGSPTRCSARPAPARCSSFRASSRGRSTPASVVPTASRRSSARTAWRSTRRTGSRAPRPRVRCSTTWRSARP